MAGANNSNFSEKLTPYLQQQLIKTSEKYLNTYLIII